MIYNHKKYSQRKSEQLGMNITDARTLLGKQVQLMLIQKIGLDTCFQCGERLTDPKDISIEHKIPYIGSENPLELFFDLNNIAFSHIACNTNARRAKGEIKHGTNHAYNQGCRCDECKNCHKLFMREARERSKQRKLTT